MFKKYDYPLVLIFARPRSEADKSSDSPVEGHLCDVQGSNIYRMIAKEQLSPEQKIDREYLFEENCEIKAALEQFHHYHTEYKKGIAKQAYVQADKYSELND
eukprot:UN07086